MSPPDISLGARHDGTPAPLLQLDGVCVSFAGLKALRDVSFSLEPGRIGAVIGPNGAGKSTLFNTITGYVRPASGTVRFDGQALAGMKPHRIAQLGMRRTFQNGGAFGSMTVLENVLAGLHARTDSSPLGIVLGLGGARAQEAQALRQARDLIALMGLDALSDRVTRDLSSGQQRIVEITRALAARTRLLLLDEPAVGLSGTERDHLMSVLRNLAGQGISILLVEHTIDMVMAISDAIVVLNYGQVIAAGTPDEIRAHPAVLEAYLGH
ncbi:ABC transporter ATP-binding protein [Bordetella genomosp. 13]|uniref:ABC transporter ATP-binding protein n=1 Tax=Bordetella genomosp. 13 TaxID=463040 RepID=UPI0011A2766C|nr:ABC transporter ATP-binding protein [Bordetella genomosp. 13]